MCLLKYLQQDIRSGYQFALLVKLTIFISLMAWITSCKKLVEVSPPVRSITTTQTFGDSADATSAIAGVYSAMINTGYSIDFGDGAITTYCGTSADELIPFNSGGDQIYTNTLLPSNGQIYGSFWEPAYQFIYQLNASIEGLQASTGISTGVKTELIGEAKFLRAFFYFYLVNLFGDVPMITTSDFKSNATASRASSEKLYAAIVQDLTDAQATLPDDYSAGKGERIRANKWGATALLARVYLYTKDWKDAEAQASQIINNTSLFGLNPELNDVFQKNNSEAILQLQLNTAYGAYNATPEGFNFIRFTPVPPTYYLSPQLLASFDSGDLRKTEWIDSTVSSGQTYYWPYKYKIGYTLYTANAPATEYYMLLRVAEQYLIRSEARAQQNSNLPDAISDLNVIRERAGLTDLPTTLNQTQTLQAIAHERQTEFFCEWGHRWLDLKRTDAVDSVMSVVTPTKAGGDWNHFQSLYPIPYTEITRDPNLTQNTGY